MGGYDLVHYDDLAYVASAHGECEYYFASKLHYPEKEGKKNNNSNSTVSANVLFLFRSIKDWSIWYDSLPIPNKRRFMAVAADKL